MLSVRDLSAGILSGIDLDVAAGEIVGVAGLLGSGRSTLLRAIFGALPRAAGSLAIDGQLLRDNGPAGTTAAGVAYVPEDRLGETACTSRWLRRDPRVLLLDEPTQGVDAVARHEVYRAVRDAAGQGAAILVASSDFEELALICHRALVLRQGRITAEVAGSDLDETRLTALVQSPGDGL